MDRVQEVANGVAQRYDARTNKVEEKLMYGLMCRYTGTCRFTGTCGQVQGKFPFAVHGSPFYGFAYTVA